MIQEFKPKKSLGQNFIINLGVLDKIVSAAELSPDDTVLEIGPGTGNLTKLLSEKAGHVITIEKDSRLIENLQEKFKDSSVEIIEADILKFRIENLKLLPAGYKIVANIPYYITSNLIKTVFEKWPKPKLIVMTIQKEVAQRIVAKPPDMNLLALSVQLYSGPKIISYISRGSFRPIPKIDSAIIRLEPRADSFDQEITQRILHLARKAFAGKRKQLKNTLGANLLTKVGLNHQVRPEELTLDDWLKLAHKV